MTKTIAAAPQTLVPQKGWRRFVFNFKRDWMLWAMCLVPMIYVLIFNYLPMYGIQIAFKQYSPRKGIWGSEWVGFDNYKDFFGYYRWTNLIVNTLMISLYELVVWPVPIVLALILHVYQGKKLKKVVQNVSYMPHFISLVIMVGLLFSVFNPISGFVGTLNRAFGWKIPDIRGAEGAFRHLYVWSGVWQGAGWGTILYISALSGVPDEIHEAAKVDGASRLRRVFVVDLPTLYPMMSLMLIMKIGGMLSVGYQKAFLMMTQTNKDVSEMISVYVYTQGIRSGNMSFGQAVGLLSSVVNFTLVLIANKVADVLSDGEMALF